MKMKIRTLLIAIIFMFACSENVQEVQDSEIKSNLIQPFKNIAKEAFGGDFFIENRYPGVAVFDFDRDEDLDLYFTSSGVSSLLEETRGGSNKFFENLGNNKFQDITEKANLSLLESNSTAPAACDFNNDGYQDLYVASYGTIGDGLDYRSVEKDSRLYQSVKDRIFKNNKDGTFTDITEEAFGESVNIRSGMSVACGDVNNDGLLDIYVGNRADQDFIVFNNPRHHGHHNFLYINNGNFKFTEIGESAGVRGNEILMIMPTGEPIEWFDEESNKWNQGYDPNLIDRKNNKVGDPSGQTLASMFWDHDQDNDIDLWISDDGDRLKVYENNSTKEDIKFDLISRELGIDKVGAWMGFTIGDIDNDLDLDVFVTNIGYHPLTIPHPSIPGGDCAYGHKFEWGTCFHYLLRNDSITEGNIKLTEFTNISNTILINKDQYMPTKGLNKDQILDEWQVPEGLDAYEFGFGTSFFDYENDGDDDLYWLGSMGGRGEGPGGNRYPNAGRMLINNNDNFSDKTTEAQLLDIMDVDYKGLYESNPEDLIKRRIDIKFHENGKGLARGDINSDGFVDLIATNSNGYIFGENDEGIMKGGPIFLWINQENENNWIKLRLVGSAINVDGGSNADAIGSTVKIKYLENNKIKYQIKSITSGESFISSNSLNLNFGLGSANKIEEISINWPNGSQKVITNVDSNQFLIIYED